MNARLLVGLSLAVAASGCTAMKLNIQKDKMAAAKSIAIVGFSGTLDLEDEKPKGGIAAMVGDIKGNVDLMSGKLDQRRIEQAERSYSELTTRLSSTFNAAISDRASLSRSQAYAALLAKSPSRGLRTLGLQHLPDVLQPNVIVSAKPNVRATIAQELGADALAVISVRYEIGKRGGFAIGGLGKTLVHPRAVVSFTVFDAKGDVIWRDSNARGEPTDEGLATTMGAAIVENETQVLSASLSTGLDALMKRYAAAP